MCHCKKLAWFPLQNFRQFSKDKEEGGQWHQNPLEAPAPWGVNLYNEICIRSDLLI